MYEKKIVHDPSFLTSNIFNRLSETAKLKLSSSFSTSCFDSDRLYVSIFNTSALLENLYKKQILSNVFTQEFCKTLKAFELLFNDHCVFAYFTIRNSNALVTNLFQHNEKYSSNFLMSTPKKVLSQKWETSFHTIKNFRSFPHYRHCIILPITTYFIQSLYISQINIIFLSRECLSIRLFVSSKLCTLEKSILKALTYTHFRANNVIVVREYVPVPMKLFSKSNSLLQSHTNLTLSEEFLQQLAPFIRWVIRNHQQIDSRVNNSIRVPTHDESIEAFWKKLYEHETELIIAPLISLHIPLSDIILVPIHHGKKNTLSAIGFNPENVSQKRRLMIITWIRSFVNDMQWHESTFFVAVHILDSYVAKLFHSCSFKNRISTKTAFPPFYVSISEIMCNASVNPDFNWSLAGAAALCLAVALEEEHTETLRARKKIIGSQWFLATQLNATKGSMLSCLTHGFLIMQTPEDFLYYFLANMKNSLAYKHMYCSLKTVPQDTHIFDYILFCKQHVKPFKNFSFTMFELQKQQIFSIWNPCSKELNQMYTICLSTLAGLVRFVLLSTCVAFMTGFYSMLPTSRLTAVCLVIGLSSSICPQLCNNLNLLNQFCQDILHFDNVKEFISTITFCLPLFQQSIHDILNQKRTCIASSSAIFSTFENFSYQINSIVKQLSNSPLIYPNP
ncbi:uncharacterized protein LOC128882865 [Hylaeus volcanicus]|uniref:uncharacterized protein LOC128882865 n=1 Tax=Hylaeus volcanicus TaxID=313075 RepID=UPI0023B78BB1|nr:uncharacterized protein LOC128882865 [Hylaeus volcanicus]